jgi:alcohol oxidase
VSTGSVHIKLGEDHEEVLDFTTGFLDEWVSTTSFMRLCKINNLFSPSDIVPLTFGYKKLREIVRRMPSYRGEIPASHPRFPEGSAAACGEVSGPVDLNAPDIVYTAEDDEAIDNFHRDHSKLLGIPRCLRQDTELHFSANDMALGVCS